MTRRTVDWLLILVLTGSWAALVARAVDDGLRTERGMLPLTVRSADDADSYPVVRWGVASGSDVPPGAEVLAIAGDSQRGVSALEFYDRFWREVRENGAALVSAAIDGGARFEFELLLHPNPG